MSLAHSAHNSGQVPWAGALSDDDDLDDEPYRLGKHDSDEKQPPSHLHFHDDHHGSTVYHPATDSVPASRLSTSAALRTSSDQSTPSQTQSSASSTFTPLSAFPSAPSRLYAAADTEADAHAYGDGDIDADAGAGSRASDVNGVADTAYDRVAEATGNVVPLPGINILSLHCSSQPPPGLPSSSVPRTPHTQDSANNSNDNAEYDADDGICNASDLTSLSSHALSLDQTRLRIAYLVSTMVKPPTAAASQGGTGHSSEGGVSQSHPRTASQEVVVSATVGGLQPEQIRSYRVAVDDVTGSALAPRRPGLPTKARRIIPPVYRLQDLVKWFAKACPYVWPTADPAKKQQKIFTIAMWQTEVAITGDSTYCSCPAGEDFLRHRVLRQLATEVNADRCSNELPDNAATETGLLEFPLERAGSAGGNSDITGDTASDPGECCTACGHLLSPRRPVVWVRDGVGWSARAQEAAGDTIRRAFKSIRGLMAKKTKRPSLTREILGGLSNAPRGSKRPKGLRGPKESSAVAVATGSREPEQSNKKTKQGGTGPTSHWDQWDEFNCANIFAKNPANADAFSPRTAMYRTVGDPEEEDDASAWSLSEENEDAEARARRRKRKMDRRLQRAQRLLQQTLVPWTQTYAAGAIAASEIGELVHVRAYADDGR